MSRPWLAIILLAAALTGCDSDVDRDTSRPHPRPGYDPDISVSLVDEGRITYTQYCVGCHGQAGDGNGDAAKFLFPKPRNFVAAEFKFSSTPAGSLPTDDDLRRTIRNGLRGSAMPPFTLLPDRTIDALVAYIKSLSPRWKEQDPAAPVLVVKDPYRRLADKSSAIRRGEAVYHGLAICWSCHPAYVPEAQINTYIAEFGSPPRAGFRPHLEQSEGKPNNDGDLVYPPDFRRDFVRAGMRVEDLYRSIAAGITSTAMPTWVDSIVDAGAKSEDLWAMAYYVQSLIAQRPALLADGRFDVRVRPRPIYLHGAPPKPAEPAEPVDSGAALTTRPAAEQFQE
ncbi:MAG: c-type cytochrome [Phycisphaerae bacterium]